MSVAVAAPSGCTRCASPLEEGDLRCSVCALPVPVQAALVDKARSQILRCTECGAAIGFDANKQAPACGFCGAVMKVEQPIDPIEVATRRLPFMVDQAQASASLRAWLGTRGWFAPKTLKDEAVLETLHPLFWAAWIVDAQAAVSWAADSNEGARRSAWAPHSGQLSLRFDNIVVPASRGLRFDECVKLVPAYDLATVVPIERSGFAGPRSAAEGGRAESIDAAKQGVDAEAVVESFDAQRSAARQQVNAGIEATATARVQQVIPGSKFRNVHVSCLLERQTTDRVALPAWVLAYRYRGSPYRAIVHGQNPAIVFGASPTDAFKVALVLFAILAAIAGVVALIAALS